MSRSTLVSLAVWLAVSLVWGTSWGTIKVGLRDLPPFAFSALRTLLAAVVLTVVALWTQGSRRPVGRAFWFWAAVGLLQLAVPYGIVFWAETRLSSGLTAMVIGTYPAFTALLAHYLVPGEPLSSNKVLAGMVALAAVALLAGSEEVFAARAFWPMMGVLLASLSSALANVLVKRHGTDIPTLWLATIQVGSSAVLLLVLSALLEHDRSFHWTPTALGAVAYLGLVVTVGCFSGMFWLLKRMDTTLVSMTVVIETAVAVLVGAVMLAEPVGPRVLGGLGLVALSVVLVVRPPGSWKGNFGRRETGDAA